MAAIEKLRASRIQVPCVFCLTFSSACKSEDDHDFLLRSTLSKIIMEKGEEKSVTGDFEGVEPWEGLVLCYPCKEIIFSIRALHGQILALQQRMTFLAQSLVDKIEWSKETHKIVPLTFARFIEGDTRQPTDQGVSIEGPSTVNKIKRFYRDQDQEHFFQNWSLYRAYLSKVKSKKDNCGEYKPVRLSVPTASALVNPKIAFDNKRRPVESNKISFSSISDSVLKRNQPLPSVSSIPTTSTCATPVPVSPSPSATRTGITRKIVPGGKLVTVVPPSAPVVSVPIDDLSNSVSKSNGKTLPTLAPLKSRPSAMSAAQMMSAAVTKRSGNPPSQLNVARYTPRIKNAECVTSSEMRNQLKAKEKMREKSQETKKTNKRKSTIVCREDWSSIPSDSDTNEEYSSDNSDVSDNSGSKRRLKSTLDPAHPTLEVILPATSEDGIDSSDEEEELPQEDPLAGTDPLKEESTDYIEEDLEEQSEDDDPLGLRVEVKEEEIIVKLEPQDYV